MPTVVTAGVHARSAPGAGAIAQSVHDTRDDGGPRLGASAVAPGADGPHSLAFVVDWALQPNPFRREREAGVSQGGDGKRSEDRCAPSTATPAGSVAHDPS
jgi:hypothetical protein